MDPLDFLVATEPFQSLSGAGRARVEKSLEIEYVAEGKHLLERGGTPSPCLWIVRKGGVRLELDGVVVDVLGPGEAFGFPSLLAHGPPRFDAIADEGSLVYRVPAADFDALLQEPSFEEFFRSGLTERLRKATDTPKTSLVGDFSTEVGSLVGREPVFVAAHATVGEAARTMHQERVSSVLVRGEPAGILTDRDLRSRVLAEGRGPDTPVSEVMSSPLRTLPAEAPIWEALMRLLRDRLHHLPIERDGEVIGMLTHTDLLRHHGRSPSQLLKKVEKSRGAHELEGFTRELAATVEALLLGGLGGSAVGHVIASLNDAVVVNTLRRAEKELGSPPCAYAWMGFGSEGRREPTLRSEQNNALVYVDAGHREWFEALATRVVGELARAGRPPRDGDFVATQWCHSLAKWEKMLEEWTSDPEAEFEAAHFFDFRALYGELDLKTLHSCIENAVRRESFLTQLAGTALRLRPPIGLFHRIKAEDGAVDLRAGALLPLIGIARVLGLAAGSRDRGTVARLHAAVREGLVSGDDADALEEGFQFLFGLRLRNQLAQAAAGDSLQLDDLSSLDARHLKETLLHIRHVQSELSRRFRVELRG